jgi:hypothetical protein
MFNSNSSSTDKPVSKSLIVCANEHIVLIVAHTSIQRSHEGASVKHHKLEVHVRSVCAVQQLVCIAHRHQ